MDCGLYNHLQLKKNYIKNRFIYFHQNNFSQGVIILEDTSVEMNQICFWNIVYLRKWTLWTFVLYNSGFISRFSVNKSEFLSYLSHRQSMLLIEHNSCIHNFLCILVCSQVRTGRRSSQNYFNKVLKRKIVQNVW